MTSHDSSNVAIHTLKFQIHRAVPSRATPPDTDAMTTLHDAVLSGYDEIVSAEDTPSARAKAKKTRLDAFARAYARQMELDASDDDDDDDDDDDANGRRAIGREESFARARVGADGSEDEEARDWRAMRAGVVSPRLDRSTRRRREAEGDASRGRSGAARSLMSAYEKSASMYETFEDAVRAVEANGEEAAAATTFASRRASARAAALEDSARKTVEEVEAKVMAYEREADDFVAKRLHVAFKDAGLGEEAEEAFRARARDALTKQSRAFEEVIEAADRALISRIEVAANARETMCATLGEEFVEEHRRANAVGFDATLGVGVGGNFATPFVRFIGTTVRTAVKTVRFTVTAPISITTGITQRVFRTRRRQAERTVEDYRNFRITSPQKSPRYDAAPFSPTKSDISSLHSSRRWPLGATAQRAHGATKRYSVAGSVRSAITRHTIYSNVEYASDAEEDEFDEPSDDDSKNFLRALLRIVQVGCFTAIVSLSAGPGERAKRTRDIAIKAWNNVRVHVEKGWIAVVARWATVSPKLTAARKQLKRRAPTKVTNREVPIQVPAYMAPETETATAAAAAERRQETSVARTSGAGDVESMRAFGRG